MSFFSAEPIVRSFCLAATVLIVSACSASTKPTPTANPTTAATATVEPGVDAFTMNRRLAKTVNLGNALEAPNEGEWGVTLQEEFFQVISQKGFTAVRLPVRWSAHALKEAPYTVDAEFFKRVDWAIEQAFSNHLAIVVNMHHYEEMALDPKGHQERYLAIWKQIAEHYQSYSNELLFEPLNEPSGILNYKYWNDLLALTIPVIRASNPTRNLVIGPANSNSPDDLDDLTLPAEDRHIIVTFHFYNPYQFTHQGADWVQGAASWTGTEWKGSSAEKQLLQFDLKQVEQWAKDNQRPIFMGEFGAYDKADMDSRVRWTAFMAREAEARNFSWGYWEFCAGFGLYDMSTSQWREPLVQALLPPE